MEGQTETVDEETEVKELGQQQDRTLGIVTDIPTAGPMNQKMAYRVAYP